MKNLMRRSAVGVRDHVATVRCRIGCLRPWWALLTRRLQDVVYSTAVPAVVLGTDTLRCSDSTDETRRFSRTICDTRCIASRGSEVAVLPKSRSISLAVTQLLAQLRLRCHKRHGVETSRTGWWSYNPRIIFREDERNVCDSAMHISSN